MRRLLAILAVALLLVGTTTTVASADQSPIYGQVGACRFKLGFWSNLPSHGYVQAVSTGCSYISVQVYGYGSWQVSPYGKAFSPGKYLTVSTHLPSGQFVYYGRAWGCAMATGQCASVFGYRVL